LGLASAATPYERLENAFVRMRWELLVPPRDLGFATSDNPVLPGQFVPGPVIVPLSRNVLLRASWSKGNDLIYVESSAREVHMMNALSVGHSYTQVFSPMESNWIWRVQHGHAASPGDADVPDLAPSRDSRVDPVSKFKTERR